MTAIDAQLDPSPEDNAARLVERCRDAGNASPLSCAVPSWFDADLLVTMLCTDGEMAADSILKLVESGLGGVFATFGAQGRFAVGDGARTLMLDALDGFFPDANRRYHERAFAWFAGALRALEGEEHRVYAEEAMRLLASLFYLYADYGLWDGLAQTLASAAAAGFDEPLHQQTLRYYVGVLLNEQQDYAGAERELLELCAETADTALAARAYTALGVVYDYLQRFESAIEAYEQSALLYRQEKNPGGEARAIKNQGIVYHQLAEYAQARTRFEEAFAIAQTLDDPVLTGRCLMELGYTDKQLGKWKSALEHYGQSLHIWEQKQNKDYQARLHNNLGEVFLLTGGWEEASGHFAGAAALYEQQPEHDRNWREFADVVHNLALLEMAHERYGEAAARLQEALTLAQKVDDATATARAHHGMGRICVRTGDLPGAHACFAAAVAKLEQVSGRIDEPDVRVSYRATQQRTYEDMVLLCLEQGDTAAAFTYVEQAKARVLLDELNSEEAAQELRRRPPMTAAEMQKGLPPDVALVVYFATGKAGPAEAMLNRLPTQAASVRSLFLPPEQLLAFVVDCDNLVALPLGTSMTRIEAAYLQRLSGRLVGTTPAEGEPMAPPLRWHALHRQIVEPLVPHLAGRRRVVLVPHGTLHYIPLHALGENGQLLQDRGIAVSYAPSGSVLFRTGFPQRAKGITAVASSERKMLQYVAAGANLDGLVHTEAEAAWVAARLTAFGGESLEPGNLLLGPEATVELVKARLAAADLAHLACHGHFHRVTPMKSGLQMWDGLLTADAILPLRLRADLVVLSACDTGLNKLTHGDELFGLTRAFLTAGVRSLLVTLWPVTDLAARLFMESFYRAWIEQGAPFAVALAAAQHELRSIDYAALRRRMEGLGIPPAEIKPLLQDLSVRWPGDRPFDHPYYWGAFVLTGNPG